MKHKKELIDTLHRCITCNAPAYEVGKGEYKCSVRKCGCKWRVISCE